MDSYINIEHNDFEGCTSLISINVDGEGGWLTSKDGVLYNKDQTELLAFPCGRSGEYTIPSFVTTIGEGAFMGCGNLSAINIPNTVINIWRYAFKDCSGLSYMRIPATVKTLNGYLFSGCNLFPLVIQAESENIMLSCCEGLGTESVVYVPKEEHVSVVQNYWPHDVRVIGDSPYKIDISTYLKGFSLKVSDMTRNAPDIFTDKFVTTGIEFVDSDDKTIITLDETGAYTKFGLPMNTKYGLSFHYTQNGEPQTMEKEVLTGMPSIGIRAALTQTTADIGVTAGKGDESATLTEAGFIINDDKYPVDLTYNDYSASGSQMLSGLTPGEAVEVKPYAVYGDETVIGESHTYTTNKFEPKVKITDVSSTSFNILTSIQSGDATITDMSVTLNGDRIDNMNPTGLEPGKYYYVDYTIKAGEYSENARATVTLPSLKLTTLTPKGVSNTCSILAATTNLSEDETNAGFQWKKYDAPSSLAPNEGYAAVYNGQLEGYVKNLQATSYYKVRAFYKSAAGKYYYGDWVTFDPSDFSYIEPTVHTYAAEEVTESSAKVKGYVLAGTDEVTEQGFEYWPAAEGENSAKAKRVAAASAANGVETVLTTGQVMTAELKNLQPGTTYSLRAFVKTTAGTVYGEEQTFTTMGSATGISCIMSNGIVPTIEGYYDLGGRKLQQPRRGVNIVRYTDGSSRKVIIK